MSVTIYHNPSCGTSRNTLAMIRQSGEAPEVIEYLKNPPSRAPEVTEPAAGPAQAGTRALKPERRLTGAVQCPP